MSIFKDGLFENNVVLVTGGGTGIGRDIALQFARLGARVAICGRREAPLLETIGELKRYGAECFHTTCDIRNADSCKDTVGAVLQRFGRLDILVNNAGGQFPSPAENITPKGFSAVVNNNLMGTWNMIYAAAHQAFLKQNSGTIINIIANVFRGFPTMMHTGAARAGVDNITKTLAVEWAKYNIRINAIAPGIIESSGTTDTARYGEGMLSIAQHIIPMKRVGILREVTDCVLFLASSGASFITGITVYIDGAQSLSGDMGQISSQVIPPLRSKL